MLVLLLLIDLLLLHLLRLLLVRRFLLLLLRRSLREFLLLLLPLLLLWRRVRESAALFLLPLFLPSPYSLLSFIKRTDVLLQLHHLCDRHVAVAISKAAIIILACVMIGTVATAGATATHRRHTVACPCRRSLRVVRAAGVSTASDKNVHLRGRCSRWHGRGGRPDV